MNNSLKSLIPLLLLLIFSLEMNASGDGWTLRKEKNGIQVYTKKRPKSNLYMYKVKTQISAPLKKVYEQVIDFRENLKYMEMVDSLSFLDQRKDKRYINYMRFDMPWPVTNREMVMEMNIKIQKNKTLLVSNDLPGYTEPKNSSVQIEDFHEEWTIEAGVESGTTKLTIEGWVNPGGNIPSWVVNLFSVRTPYRFISGIIEEVKLDYSKN